MLKTGIKTLKNNIIKHHMNSLTPIRPTSNQPRNTSGQFARRNRFALRITIFIILSLALIIGVKWYMNKYPTIVTNTVTIDASPAQLSAKIDTLEISIVAQVQA